MATKAPENKEAKAPKEGDGYAVQWHIKCGGVLYGPGATVHLTEDKAAPFVASGAVVKIAEGV